MQVEGGHGSPAVTISEMPSLFSKSVFNSGGHSTMT